MKKNNKNEQKTTTTPTEYAFNKKERNGEKKIVESEPEENMEGREEGEK